MSEISHLLRQGWKNLWREKIVWLFTFLSSLTFINGFVGSPKTLVGLLFYFTVSVALGLLMIAGITGVIYIAYRTAMGETITLSGAWLGVRKNFGRVTAFNILLGISTMLLIAPCFCFLTFQLLKSESTQFPGKIILALAPAMFIIGIFSGLFYYLPILDIVAKGSGIRKSIANAWKLFTGHLGLFLRLGLILTVISTIVLGIYLVIAYTSWSNFDQAAAGSLNTENPFINLARTPIYWLSYILSLCLYTYVAFVFSLVYYETSNHKNQKKIVPHK